MAIPMFIRRFKLFTLFGIDVYVDVSWFFIVVLIAWSLATATFPHYYKGLTVSTYWWMGAAGALGLFASILLHEFGHSLVARQYGVSIKGITLFIFGGVAEMDREPPSARVEFFVAVAGPVVSAVIAIACYELSRLSESAQWPTPLTAVVWYLGWINAIVVGFNLVPAFPLDGGRVLRSLLWHARGNLKWATRVTSSIGSAFGLVLIILGVMIFIGGNIVGGMWQFLIGVFLRNAAQMSYQNVLVRRALEGEPIRQLMESNVHTVSPAFTIEQLIDDYVYRHHHKMYPVIENGRLLGCVMVADAKNVPRNEWAFRTVAEVIRPCEPVNTVAPDADAMQALAKMGQGVSRLMVAENGQLRGVISLKDMMRFIS